MAKRLSVSSILSMDLEQLLKMKYSELRDVSKVLRDAANKRLRRLESKGLSEYSEAYIVADTAYGAREVNGRTSFVAPSKRTLGATRAQVFALKRFLTLKTTTVPGTREYIAKMKLILPTEWVDDSDNYKKFWRAYKKYLEQDKKMIFRYRDVIDTLSQYNTNLSIDRLVQKLKRKFKDENKKLFSSKGGSLKSYVDEVDQGALRSDSGDRRSRQSAKKSKKR